MDMSIRADSQRLFSGIQPTGTIHLGNYLGAITQWVALQETHDALYCVVDLHAITVPQDPDALQRAILDTAKWYIAAGVNPEQSTIFVQSDVSAHAELGWILNTIARMGDMEKMTQFKDKSARGGVERSSVGLFDYPVLMAADILLYDTYSVPVGEDQVQHVELTRTLARRFNRRFGEIFTIPRARLSQHGVRIMGLDNPTKKMSKSAQSAYNYILLSDDVDTVAKKVRKAVTDSGSEIVYRDDRPAIKNLLNIYHLVSGIPIATLEERYAGAGYGAFKADVAAAISAHLAPIQEHYAALTDTTVREILTRGAERARTIADKKLTVVKSAMGLG